MTLVANPADPSTGHLVTAPWNAFGQTFDNLEIDGVPAPYPVVNERAVRAMAGLMLIPAGFAVSIAYFTGNYVPIQFVVVLFLYDFLVREMFGMTLLSPFAVLGALMVKNQRPEWVGATQKRFAWGIGVGMAILMTTLLYTGFQGWRTLSLCGVCMVFMWMEAALGYCIGCKIYWFLVNRGIVKQPEVAPACPGGVCAIPGLEDK